MVVDRGGPWPEGTLPEGDAVVADGGGRLLAVLVADCAPVAMGSVEGVCGAVHAGWRGVVAGVVGEAARAMRTLGAGGVVAGLGPCIGPCCYEFSEAGLDELCTVCGVDVGARTTWGTPSLDLRAAVRAGLGRAGVDLVVDVDACTACTPGYFSHRARRDEARQALFVWRAEDDRGA